MNKGKLLFAWCRARLAVLVYVAVVFAFFFMVYGLYEYPWDVAGYATLLSLAVGLVFAGVDFARFAARHRVMNRLPGRFPTGALPVARNLQEVDFSEVITALETERARLENVREADVRDALEYYTLWVHQIKTPIAALKLLLQSDEETRYKADMEQELFRIGQYVDMVLQYQRLSSMREDMVLAPMELAPLVRAAAKNCATLFIHKRLAFTAEDVRGRVVSDEKWLGFVLEQLLTNAVKYTPVGGCVRVYSPDDITLVVEDTGIGVPPEDLPRVFERGFTGAAGRTERSSTGIGLYLCRAILLKLGFGISMESTPGQGTRVFLHLAQQELEHE